MHPRRLQGPMSREVDIRVHRTDLLGRETDSIIDRGGNVVEDVFGSLLVAQGWLLQVRREKLVNGREIRPGAVD